MNAILGYRCRCCWTWRPADLPWPAPPDMIDEGQFIAMYACTICNGLFADKDAAEQCCPNGDPAF